MCMAPHLFDSVICCLASEVLYYASQNKQRNVAKVTVKSSPGLKGAL